jgi:hypothetical protein
VGKGPELISLIKERAEAENASGGSRNGVLVEMLAPEQVIVHAIQHEDFGAWESYLARRDADSSFRTYAGKMQAAISRANVQDLQEVLVRTPATEKPTNFVWANTLYAKPGKAAELLKFFEDRAGTATKRGASSVTLMAQSFPTEGPNITMANGFTDLAGLEAYRKAVTAEPSVGSALNDLVSRTHQRLFRVVVSFPSA